MNKRMELEAERKAIARRLRASQRQGFLPGKNIDPAIVEQSLERELKAVEDQLQQLSLEEDDRR